MHVCTHKIPTIVLTILLFAGFGCTHKQNLITPTALHGIIDLRQADLNRKNATLDGEWKFYWLRLLQPQQTDTAVFTYAQFPVLWNKTGLPSNGYATYKLTVLLPHNRPPLALFMPDVYTAYNLYANGVHIASNGVPATNEKAYTPRWISNNALLPDIDTLEIVLQVANFLHSKGGPYKQIIIGERGKILLAEKTNLAADFLLGGSIFMSGLFFFSLYVFGKRDKATLFFSLFSFFFSYRIVGSRMYALHSVLPNLNWHIAIHAEYLSLYTAVAMFAMYLRHLYPADSSKKIVYFMVGVCCAFNVITILFPPAIFTTFITSFLILAFFYILYVLYVYTRAYKNKRIGSFYALLSIAIMMLLMVVIDLEYFELITYPHLFLFIGYVVFFFLQSLILSFRFAYDLKLAKNQAEEGLKAKSEFLSTMSHEIRTPLNSVIGMSHLMLQSHPREDQKEQLDVLLFAANNLLSIVNDILDFNKIEANKIRFENIEMNLGMLAVNIVNGLNASALEKGIELKLYTDKKLEFNVLGDPTRTAQVLTNLVQNAIKFTKQGYVLLSINIESILGDFATIHFMVKDTGIGIPLEKQKLIFEEFTQADSSTSRSFGGTGLGLAISKRILDLQGSKLLLRSKEGEGSEFYFTQKFTTVLRKAPTDIIKTAAVEDIASSLQGITILLVDDNRMNVFVAKSFLEKWGARIDVAYNGIEALEKLDVAKHNIVVMDMHMPEMDGYEAARMMRLKGVKLPIIALTASLPKNNETNKIADAGMDGVIIKPFEPKDLLRIVLQHLKK